MAGAFTKPKDFDYEYNLGEEKENIDKLFERRKFDSKAEDEIDIATWNIANLGVQGRREKDLELIAYILSKFEIIAIQEIRSNISQYMKIMSFLEPLGYKTIFTDVAGGGERMAVVYDTQKLELGTLIGELDYNPNGKVQLGQYIMPSKKQSYKLDGETIHTFFKNFNRNPFLSTWKIKNSSISFLLANVHIYFGKEEDDDEARFKNRIAEVFFLAEWAKEMQKEKNKDKVYERNIILIGDMNVPKMSSRDKVYRALKRRGFINTKYSTEAGSTIKEFKTYDQIIFSNGKIPPIKIDNNTSSVVDFDNFIFKDLYKKVLQKELRLADFKAWTKFSISDHRPLFTRIKIS